MLSRSVVLLTFVLAVTVKCGLAACPHVDDVLLNNGWTDAQTGFMTQINVTGVTAVSFKASAGVDISDYIDVTANDTGIQFTALDTFFGVRDYPHDSSMISLSGDVEMECGNDTGSFSFEVYIKDANTATPKFTESSYQVTVAENFPLSIPIPGLRISGQDDDAEKQNYELSFVVEGDGGFFALTEPVKEPDTEPTYSVQLMLKQALNWTEKQEHRFTVKASDPGGLNNMTEVIVTVTDVDNMQPEFSQFSYSAAVVDPTDIGPVPVTPAISAKDADMGGPLVFTLKDPSQDGWGECFQLDPDTAQLSLKEDISTRLPMYATTITFLLEVQESNGLLFTDRAALTVELPGQTPTTTTTPETSTTVTTPGTSPTTDTASTTPVTTPTTPVTSPTTPVTSPTTPVTTPTTPVTTPTTPVTTPTTPATSPTTPVTSPTTPATSPLTTSPGPTPTPQPCPTPIFTQSQYHTTTQETYTGHVITVSADKTSQPVEYYVLTPRYAEFFSINKTTGELMKEKELNYQTVTLLVQAVISGDQPREPTNQTDKVEWDETLIIINVQDDNDHAPVLDCSMYAADCSSVVIGVPSSSTAATPVPVMRVTATDEDTGSFGSAGVVYRVEPAQFSVDTSGIVYLTRQLKDTVHVSITAIDDNGNGKQGSAASVTVVPVTDANIYYISTRDALTDTKSVRDELDRIKDAGSYAAVFSPDFQALRPADKTSTGLAGLADSTQSKLFVYALTRDSSVVQKESMKTALEKTGGSLKYIETKEDQVHGGSSGESSSTGLVVAVVVLAVLLVVVIVGAVLRQRHLLRSPGNSAYTRQRDEEDTASGEKGYRRSPPPARRADSPAREIASYENPSYMSQSNSSHFGTKEPISEKRRDSPPIGEPRRDSPLITLQDPPAIAGLAEPEQPISVAAETGQPISVTAENSQPMSSPPDEPKPDYKLVGFLDTVTVCPVPGKEEREEEEREEEEQEEEQQEDAGEAAEDGEEEGKDGKEVGEEEEKEEGARRSSTEEGAAAGPPDVKKEEEEEEDYL